MKVLIYDAAEKTFLGKLWAIGAFFFGFRFKKVIAAKSWEQALTELEDFVNLRGVPEEVQLWSHGWIGMPLINMKSMPLNDKRIYLTDRWWFRCCYTVAGDLGHSLVNRFTSNGVEVAGHTVVIGLWGLHPRLYCAKAYEDAWWTKELEEDRAKPSLFSPRTISALRMSLPKWSYKK